MKPGKKPDLNLPVLSSEVTLNLLKSISETCSIPVVILSADATRGQVETLLANGAADYLTKPVDLRLLNSVLLQFLPVAGP